LLHELGGSHGEVVRWLEQQLEEHGPLTWGTLNEAMEGREWADAARGWVRAGLGDEEYRLDGLQQIVSQLWRQLLRQEADVIAAATPTAEDLARYRALMEQIAALKSPRDSQAS
jgi:DNA primase